MGLVNQGASLSGTTTEASRLGTVLIIPARSGVQLYSFSVAGNGRTARAIIHYPMMAFL